MKKAIIILILAFLVCSGRLFAAPRTPQQALEVARTFDKWTKHTDTNYDLSCLLYHQYRE